MHFAENAMARSAQAGSSRSRWPYSFIDDPHPAELITMASTWAASKTAIIFFARVMASSSNPECTISAPQQPCSRGINHLATFRGQHARSGSVHVRKENLLHAPGQHAHAQARRSLGYESSKAAC